MFGRFKTRKLENGEKIVGRVSAAKGIWSEQP
jgi:hypothetical protein